MRPESSAALATPASNHTEIVIFGAADVHVPAPGGFHPILGVLIAAHSHWHIAIFILRLSS